MSDTSELYELLKAKDAEIRALREVVNSLINGFASFYAEDEQDLAYSRASEALTDTYYAHGFKSDGSWRGAS